MNLFLLRHADAEDVSSTGKDADRALSARGREQMEVVAKAFARVGEPNEIFHSPLRRAKETAEFVAAQIPKAKLTSVAWLVPDADPRLGFDEIRGGGDVLWVGHQPHLGRVLGYSVTGSADAEIPMKKAAIARISFSGTHPSPPGTLKWLISPALAQRIR